MNILPRRFSENPQKNISNRLRVNSPGGRRINNNSSEGSDSEFLNNSQNKNNKPKSEKKRSIHLNLATSNQLSIKPKRNFMSLQSSELEDLDIYGYRKILAMRLQTTNINMLRVILIISYCILTFVFTSISQDLDKDVLMPIYHTFEGLFIILFAIEILLYKYAFKEMFHLNRFNFANSIIVIIITIFWIGDIAISNYTISILLRIRGVMRLIHIPVIFDNIQSHMRIQIK